MKLIRTFISPVELKFIERHLEKMNNVFCLKKSNSDAHVVYVPDNLSLYTNHHSLVHCRFLC